MTDQLTGKTILITGASSGIGESAAHLFAREGANVVITARRKAELDRVAEDIAAAEATSLPFRPTPPTPANWNEP